MKKTVIKNSLLIVSFILINFILIAAEKNIKESSSELLTIFWFISLFIGIVITNFNIYENVKLKSKRFLLTCLIICTIFVFSWGFVYFLNWYIIYPIIN